MDPLEDCDCETVDFDCDRDAVLELLPNLSLKGYGNKKSILEETLPADKRQAFALADDDG